MQPGSEPKPDDIDALAPAAGQRLTESTAEPSIERDHDTGNEVKITLAGVREMLASGNAPVVLHNIDNIIEVCGQEAFLTVFLDVDDTVRDGRMNLLRSPMYRSKFDDDVYAKFLDYGAPRVADPDKDDINHEEVARLQKAKEKERADRAEREERERLERINEPAPEPQRDPDLFAD